MRSPAPEGYVPHGLDVLRTYGEGFAGREVELAALDSAWNEGTRVFVLHAEGGAGKTRVVAKWLTQVRDAGWRGAGRVFVHSFYGQGSNPSSELFFEQALEHFGHSGPLLKDPTEKGRTLARLVVEQHGLLVLDGLEPLQHPPSFDQGRLKDPAIHSLLLSLAIGRLGKPSGSGLCVVTSRQPVVELRDKTGQVVVQQPLDRLDPAAGADLLRQLDARGTEKELREAVEDARGHAYSLMLLGTYLRDATADHDIRRRREIPLLDQDEEHRYHARHLFGAYVEHLGEASPEVAVLDGLQPLYQAVTHGCLAGLHEQACVDIYFARILRGTGYGGFYSSKKLGAIGANLGAVACFFTPPWTTLAPNLAPPLQAWLLNEATYYLRALGRLTEAVDPMRTGIEMTVEQTAWNNAARFSNNLGELELTRGEMATAVTVSEQSVTYADRTNDAFLQMAFRAMQAHALHQAGRPEESRRLFEDTEARQAARQPEYSRLYSVQGFQYCDLLLAEVERLAWQRWLLGHPVDHTAAIAADTIIDRASQTLKWAEQNQVSILDVTLNHLTLARAMFYKAFLTTSNEWQSAVDHITTAADGFRAAAFADYLLRCLLSRSWLRCILGDEVGSLADLDEAWEIAERGPMPLFQADIQLTRGRLFRDRAALEEARRLIEKHGYHRRDGELADALEAARGWEGSLGRPAARPHPLDPPLPSPTLPPGEREAETASATDQRFDVFLSHNSKDKPAVRRLKERLAERKLRVWLDEDELRPGIRWQQLLEDGIQESRAVAVLIGKDGPGPWTSEEMEGALRLAVNDGRAVIPVLLPGAPDNVKLPLFLGNRTWVDLRPRITAQRLDRLVWGITDQKPGPR